MKNNKEFWPWMAFKQRLQEHDTSSVFFNEREVWWCAIGANISDEQDGKGGRFERPVLILRKFNRHVFLGIPLTSRPKHGRYYFPLGKVRGRDNIAILSQVRLCDRKRRLSKIDMVPKGAFADMKKAIKDLLA